MDMDRHHDVLEYIDKLRTNYTLAEAMSSLQALARDMPEVIQFVLNVDASVSMAEDELRKSAKFANISAPEEIQRWNNFIVIVKYFGLKSAMKWFQSNCVALLVPSNEEEIERCYTVHR